MNIDKLNEHILLNMKITFNFPSVPLIYVMVSFLVPIYCNIFLGIFQRTPYHLISILQRDIEDSQETMEIYYSFFH